MTNATLGWQLDPVTNDYEGGAPFVRITGSGFGSSPTLNFYDPVRGANGILTRLNSPEIGAYDEVSSRSRVVRQDNEGWRPMRDPLNVSQDADNLATLAINFPASAELFFSFRIVAQTGLRFPWTDVVGDEPTFTGSAAKPFWFTDDANTNTADLICPNWNASGMQYTGNSNGIQTASGALYALNNSSGADIKSNNATTLGMYQSGAASGPLVFDAAVEISRFDRTFGGVSQLAANPFYKVDGNGDPTPPSTSFYDRLKWASWWGLKAGDNWINQQCLVNNIYLAIGANARARVIFTDAATLAASRSAYNVPPKYWADTEIIVRPDAIQRLPFCHVITGNGTQKQNMGYTVL